MKVSQGKISRKDKTCLGMFKVFLILFLCTHFAVANETNETDVPPLTYRTWTSEAGQSIEAAFINLHENQVSLKDRKDERIVIPMHSLRWRDQIMARRLAGVSGTASLSGDRRAVTRGRRKSDARVIASFGPDCEALLIDAIKDAQHEILIAIYTMTSLSISEALQEAAKRRVEIHIKYDEGQINVGRMSEIMATLSSERNITTTPVEMRGRFASMHHKFAVIDQAAVFTGSFNFTVTAATQSYENAVLIFSDTIAELYSQEFDAITSR